MTSHNPATGGSQRATIEALLADLCAHDKDIQAVAAKTLAAAENRSLIVPRLLDLLAGADFRARWGAAYTLGLMGELEVLRRHPALIEALATDDGDVRWAAAGLLIAMARHYPAEIRVKLLDLLANSTGQVRKMALYCLRELPFSDSAIFAALRHAARDADYQIRLAVLAAIRPRLSETAPTSVSEREELIAVVLAMLLDSSPGVRRAAAALLGGLDRPTQAAYAALRRAAETCGDTSVRRIARQALERLGFSR